MDRLAYTQEQVVGVTQASSVHPTTPLVQKSSTPLDASLDASCPEIFDASW